MNGFYIDFWGFAVALLGLGIGTVLWFVVLLPIVKNIDSFFENRKKK